jgi:autotransporter passenger strand-loop-strand repeat protein
VVQSGGTQYVIFGTARNTVVATGGNEIVGFGGTDVGAHISGGTETVSWGVAIGDTIFAGSQVVSAGGTASNTIVNGGEVVLEAGAVVSGGIIFSGAGTLEIFGSTMPSATISGFSGRDVIDLASVAFVSSGSGQILSGNVLQVVEGNQTIQLQLDPSQNFASAPVLLSSDGNGGTDVTLQTVVVSGQTLTVSSGITSGNVLVKSGGLINVLSGGTAIGTTVNKGGTERVSGVDT